MAKLEGQKLIDRVLELSKEGESRAKIMKATGATLRQVGSIQVTAGLVKTSEINVASAARVVARMLGVANPAQTPLATVRQMVRTNGKKTRARRAA